MQDVRHILPTHAGCSWLAVRFWQGRYWERFPWDIHAFARRMATVQRRRVNYFATSVEPKMHVARLDIAHVGRPITVARARAAHVQEF